MNPTAVVPEEIRSEVVNACSEGYNAREVLQHYQGSEEYCELPKHDGKIEGQIPAEPNVFTDGGEFPQDEQGASRISSWPYVSVPKILSAAAVSPMLGTSVAVDPVRCVNGT